MVKIIALGAVFVAGELAIFLVVFIGWSALGASGFGAMREPVRVPAMRDLSWREVSEGPATLPDAFSLLVPFTSQAPFGNWAQPWQDFCEEAIIVMAAAFVRAETLSPILPARARDEMLFLMRYELSRFGYHKDIGAREIAETLTDRYGVVAVVKPVRSPEDVKKEILRYRAVILPLAGRELRNQYFMSPGPVYHTVLVKGYDDRDNTFITNEPGTRFGNGFRYDQNLLYQALADWDQSASGINQNKLMVVVY
ncbi:MAG: hypothetical protein A3B29_03205 [Candidatus Sungbacteria bacterium RIFCSPLOWO2_01_FULL_51_34]|nr:MAG: hypothetical protein A3B29_03205 [Candidatus Sungbacteria bacterium RIFCSPLOWO2_01_FULL_51_34]